MYLDDATRKTLGEFLASNWPTIERALMQRRPTYSESSDAAETAAHRSFERKGYEKCLEDIRALSTETPPTTEGTIPESLLDARD